MDETAIRIQWMRAVIRLSSVSNPSGWSDSDVVESFAALRYSAVGYEEWLSSMGLSEQMKQIRDALQNDAALQQLKAVAANAKIEERPS
jgi:hypothetical protein